MPLKKYEKGDSTPKLHILAKIALAFDVSADVLVFDQYGGIAVKMLDSELLKRFQRVMGLPGRERDAVIVLIDSVIAKQAIREVVHG